MARPPIYKTPAEMEARVNEYFYFCDEHGKPYSCAGLALFLDFNSYKTLYAYRDRDNGFADVIERAFTQIEAQREENVVTGKGSTIGNIFCLKAKHRWEDRHIVEHEGGALIVINSNVPVEAELEPLELVEDTHYLLPRTDQE